MLRSVSRRRNRVLKWRTAASAGVEVELVDQDEGALHAGADRPDRHRGACDVDDVLVDADRDRKSTRLNSSHMSISYAVFCLKKKKKKYKKINMKKKKKKKKQKK